MLSRIASRLIARSSAVRSSAPSPPPGSSADRWSRRIDFSEAFEKGRVSSAAEDVSGCTIGSSAFVTTGSNIAMVLDTVRIAPASRLSACTVRPGTNASTTLGTSGLLFTLIHRGLMTVFCVSIHSTSSCRSARRTWPRTSSSIEELASAPYTS